MLVYERVPGLPFSKKKRGGADGTEAQRLAVVHLILEAFRFHSQQTAFCAAQEVQYLRRSLQKTWENPGWENSKKSSRKWRYLKSPYSIYHIHSYSIYFRTTITIKTECKSAKGVSKMESFSNHTPISKISPAIQAVLYSAGLEEGIIHNTQLAASPCHSQKSTPRTE